MTMHGTNGDGLAPGARHVLQITSIAELRAAATDWDDLWRRSDVTTPTARAELVAQWLEQFRPRGRFRALVVADQGQWRGVLPLVDGRVRRWLSAGQLCGSTWLRGGGLLLDRRLDADAALDRLMTAARELPYQLLWLSEVRLDAPQWRAFQDAAARAGMACDADAEYMTGVLPINHDWQAYAAAWPKKHRQKMRHCLKLAEQRGVRFAMHAQLGPEEVAPKMQIALELEDRSWKGQAGSSELRRGEQRYITRQAEQLARWGQLRLCFLEADERPIAFAYGFEAKGAYHVCKIGYDPDYASLTPGQLLFYHLLERLHGRPECQSLDFFGKLTDALTRWQPTASPVGRMVIAPRKQIGRMVLGAHRWWKTHRRRSDAASQTAAGNHVE